MTDLVNYNAFGNLRVRKYKREVFHDNLWHKDPILLESRGHVLDENDQLLARPFKKLFNYKENGVSVYPEEEVVVVEKVNGFMFHVTYHNDDLLIQGTTGSLSSPFTELGKENMAKYNVDYEGFKRLTERCGQPMTCIFEIKDDEKDPHIIDDEVNGVYLLGVRTVSDGHLFPQHVLDEIAVDLNVLRPKWKVQKFKDALKEVADVKHEGFVVYDKETNEGLLKLKSPYYISKKSVMRKHPSRVYDDNYKSLVDEEYYPIIELIQMHYMPSEWAAMNEQMKGVAFKEAYKSTLLSHDEIIKLVTNHPKLSYNMKDDSIDIEYKYNSDAFISRIKKYRIQPPEMWMVEDCEFVCYGKTLDESLRQLYFQVFTRLGDYTFTDDFGLHSRSKLVYHQELIKLNEKEYENTQQDIEYYCN